MTWVTAVDRLPLVVGQCGPTVPARQLALEIPSGLTRQELRQLLARAAAEAPGLDAAAIRGPLPTAYRQVLIDGGIRVICCERFDDHSRGSRRPAPSGWPCRSSLWGLWEVTSSGAVSPPGMVGRLLPWSGRTGTGGLTVVDIGGQDRATTAELIQSRSGQWQAWAERQSGAGRVVFATLSDLPALIAGGGRLPESGSVLRAA